MIPPVDFLWEQMDGPQINAIEQALYDFMYAQLNPILDYLNNMSIKTANGLQISDIGKMMNLPRPVIKAWTENYIVFTDGLQHPSDAGFGDLNDTSFGAAFSDIEDMKYEYVNTPLSLYRPFLEGASVSDAEVGSLVFVDDILAALAASLGHNPESFEWTFEFLEENQPLRDFALGDVKLNIGTLIFWRGSMVGYAIIDEVSKRLYPAHPKLIPSISFQNEES